MAKPRGYDPEEVVLLLEEAVRDVTPYLPDSDTTIEEIHALLEDMPSQFGLELPDVVLLLASAFQFDKMSRGKDFDRGFPGLVVVGVVGRLVAPSYNPCKNFYGIHPRPLFEKVIRPVLGEHYHAPMGKSDPLNVAKAIDVLDARWANGRKPHNRKYAASAVRLLEWVVSASGEQLKAFLALLVWCYLSLARLYTKELPALGTGIDLGTMHTFLGELVRRAPAGGATAQGIVGALLQTQHMSFGVEGLLDGVGESVQSTNTTSGKPGDFAELLPDQLHVYEVTTKTVDTQRLRESSAAVHNYLSTLDDLPQSVEVTFLCDLEQVTAQNVVTHSSRYYSAVENGVQYSFVDLSEWVFYILERLGPNGRAVALETIQNYIADPKTPLSVKSAWRQIGADLSLSSPALPRNDAEEGMQGSLF